MFNIYFLYIFHINLIIILCISHWHVTLDGYVHLRDYSPGHGATASTPCDLKGHLFISPTRRLDGITCHKICVFEGLSDSMSS